MIIVWSGWGIVVPVFVVAAFMAMLAATGLAPNLDKTVSTEIVFAMTGLLSAVGVFFLARYLEGKPGRAFTDNATGQTFQIKPSAGSLFSFRPATGPIFWLSSASVLRRSRFSTPPLHSPCAASIE